MANEDKAAELRRSKRLALFFLLAAGAVFIVTAFLPRSLWTDGLKAVSEAAMVGALADWFAVTALFRTIPIPFISRHTNIIPRGKDRIAVNLASFVKEKFLDTDSLVTLIAKYDPAKMIGEWLAAPANAGLLGDYLVKMLSAALDMTDDARIRPFIKKAFDEALSNVDLSQSTGAILETLTANGRHQDLLDEAIAKLVAVLREPDSRELIADSIVHWLKTEHPRKEKVLPTSWLGEHGAELIASALDSSMRRIAQDPEHQLRHKIDASVHKLIQRLKTDPVFLARGEALREHIRNDVVLTSYVHGLWEQLRDWLKQDLVDNDSMLHAKVAAMGGWLGQELAQNPQLRDSLNERLQEAARAMAPDFALFLTRHIGDTVKNWDPQDLSRQIELQIGKDLQFIRINGTIVGGIIGLLLFACTQLTAALRAL
ncbi:MULTISPECIES: DUF445 domain-containing protein [unclassified Janthinobacterium]|uniref:DUF445 domain-containing protein n=1 Tax=unclassified Janthinobacterium TaxID=2610881 RepID=UPI00161BA4B8|nr:MULTISPECIES: DUF445 family protein [unclassified Janthinobacterium]MBB5371000.1 uncharacterized membrane-anchored protein YjiN (DUF445 family) [Janthinobacterium sp. K2C7]MBB5383806.1 uncharacterized membrane-anchored protein YjiN (DUF445 family) [Janthinobacterium sp. K2Li3]MBB5388311.1 uncharacterized membrane-anchored protein YjiN (DUF445 family) [Janthinobacterium sp. K2E3]